MSPIALFPRRQKQIKVKRVTPFSAGFRLHQQITQSVRKIMTIPIVCKNLLPIDSPGILQKENEERSIGDLTPLLFILYNRNMYW